MKLLILTQKVDTTDGVLSFMLGWIREFAKQCEHVTVIALYVGKYELPKNVTVLSLGKEKGVSRVKYLFNFYRYIIGERKKYDVVFVHMNHVYMLLGGLVWRLFGKRTALWFAHGSIPWNLSLATFFAYRVLSSTPSGFRLTTSKLRIIGQGINTNYFRPPEKEREGVSPIRLLVIGRISPAKDYETLLCGIKKIHEKKKYPVILDIVGGAGTPEQESYFSRMKKLTEELGIAHIVNFHGATSHDATLQFFQKADIFVSTAINGSFDKAMGDAMSTGLPVVTCSEAMLEVLGTLAPRFYFQKSNVDELVARLEELIALDHKERNQLGLTLRRIIEEEHGLTYFITKVLRSYQ